MEGIGVPTALGVKNESDLDMTLQESPSQLSEVRIRMHLGAGEECFENPSFG